MKAKLNPAQRLFAHEYVRTGGNGKQSAIAAGYTPKSAEVTASRLLRHSKVAELVRELEQKQLAKVDASAERVKAELARIAFADVSQAYDENGIPKRPGEMDESLRGSLAAYDIDDKGCVRVRFESKTAALNLLAKHHGMLREIVEQTTKHEVELTDEEWEAFSLLRHQVREKKADAP